MKIPCHECGEREIGCHGKCERYKEYCAWREKVRKNKADMYKGLDIAMRGMVKAKRRKERTKK